MDTEGWNAVSYNIIIKLSLTRAAMKRFILEYKDYNFSSTIKTLLNRAENSHNVQMFDDLIYELKNLPIEEKFVLELNSNSYRNLITAYTDYMHLVDPNYI